MSALLSCFLNCVTSTPEAFLSLMVVRKFRDWFASLLRIFGPFGVIGDMLNWLLSYKVTIF